MTNKYERIFVNNEWKIENGKDIRKKDGRRRRDRICIVEENKIDKYYFVGKKLAWRNKYDKAVKLFSYNLVCWCKELMIPTSILVVV